MSAKTKIIVIRKSQLTIAIIVLIIALLLIGLLASIIVSQSAKTNNSGSSSSETAAAESSAQASSGAVAAGSSAQASSEAAAASSSMQASSETVAASSAVTYIPGVYTSTVVLNDAAMEVQVIVDESHINSISLINIDEDVETAYPLVQPAMENLAEQIISSQSTDGITYSDSNQYTSMILHNAICDALEKAYAD